MTYKRSIMMRKVFLFLIGIMLCISLLPGCQKSSGTSDPSDRTENPDLSDQAGTQEPTSSPICINVVADWGITAGEGYGLQNALILFEKLESLQDNTEIVFPQGEYEIASPMFLVGKQNVSLVGKNVTIVRTHVSNKAARQEPLDDPSIPEAVKPYTASSSILVIKNCHGVKAEGFSFKYNVPTSLSGTVISKKDGSVTIEVDSTIDFTGEEYATIINTFTKDGVPDKTYEQYSAANFPLEKLSDNTLRISGLDAGGVSNVKKGMRVSLRLATGSDYVINLLGSTNTSFVSLTMYNSLNGGIIVGDRCKDLTVSGLTVKPENDRSLFSLNADILHISSLSGSLIVENSHLESPGDDCVNVHHMAYVVDSIDTNKVTVRAPRFSVDSSWAQAGDVIDFYDSSSFAHLGSATIIDTQASTYTFDALPANVGAGAVLSNTALRPQTIIRNVTVLSNRARGFLLQTDNVLVENCTFKDTALAAILLAPDLEHWYEMSPASNVTIRGNTFESCGKYASGIIQISASHDAPDKVYPAYVHQGITVEQNIFGSCSRSALFGVCVDSLTFQNNDFSGFRGKYATLHHCKNVTLDEQTQQNSALTDVNP